MSAIPPCARALAAVVLSVCATLPAWADRTAGAIGVLPAPIPVVRPLVAPPAVAAPAFAAPMPLRPMAAGATPGQQCRQAIRAAERAGGIPEQLMAAIGRVESGRREADGTINPWPWSINVEGTDHIYETKADAVAAVRTYQAQGVRSIDVGCMQVNLMFHPDAFATLEQAFDPAANAAYAARFLLQLKEQTGAWPTATAWYHSATPALGEDYQRKVMAVWPDEMKQPHGTERTDLASAWSATRPPSSGLVTLPTSGVFLPYRNDVGRLLPLAPGAIGRGLADYRAVPIPTQMPVFVRPNPPLVPVRKVDGRL